MQLRAWMLFAACLSLLGQTTGAGGRGGARPASFTIRVLDAHSGRPVAKEAVNAYVGVGKRPWMTVEEARHYHDPVFVGSKNGEVTIPVPDPADDTVSLIVLTDIPCQAHAPDDPNLYFSLRQILEVGAVAENVCGKARAVKVPGVLTIFVKHHPWWQIGRLVPAPASPRPDRAAGTVGMIPGGRLADAGVEPGDGLMVGAGPGASRAPA